MSLFLRRAVVFGIGVAALGFAAGTVLAEPSYRVERFEPNIPYGPIPALRPVGMSLKDGLMLKEGEPHF